MSNTLLIGSQRVEQWKSDVIQKEFEVDLNGVEYQIQITEMPVGLKYMEDENEPEKSGGSRHYLRLFRIQSKEEGSPSVTFFEPNRYADVSSILAGVAAKTSRDLKPYVDIFQEVLGRDAGEAAKVMERIFVGYGHNSVGDLLKVSLFFNNLPMSQAFDMANDRSAFAMQEGSTRYMAYEAAKSVDISQVLDLDQVDPEVRERMIELWSELKVLSEHNYKKYLRLFRLAFKKEFPTSDEDPIRESTYQSRALDIARLWLTMSTKNSAVFQMSVRDWRDEIKTLKQSKDLQTQDLAQLIEATLSISEAGGFDDPSDAPMINLKRLLRHAEPKHFKIHENLDRLHLMLQDTNFHEHFDKFSVDLSKQKVFHHATEVSLLEVNSPVLAVVMECVFKLYPNIPLEEIQSWLLSLDNERVRQMYLTLREGVSDHEEWGHEGRLSNPYLFEITTAIAYIRDLNRHRPWQRHIPYLDYRNPEAILSAGFHIPEQLKNFDGVSESTKAKWKGDAVAYYSRLAELAQLVHKNIDGVNPAWINHLLPMGHQIRTSFSGAFGYLVYLLSLRGKMGGDAGYVHAVSEMARLVCERDPYLLPGDFEARNFDPNSRQDFAARS